MKGENFYPAEEVVIENLDNLEDSLRQASQERSTDIQKYGIVHTPGTVLYNDISTTFSDEFPVTINLGDPTRVDVGAGIAYNIVGERVILPPNAIVAFSAYDTSVGFTNSINKTDAQSVPTPQSTGNQAIPLPATAPGTSYLWIDYLQTIDITEFTNDPTTGNKQYTRRTDGYQIRATTTNTPPTADSLLLASVGTDSFGNVIGSSISYTGRVFSLQQQNTISITTGLSARTDQTTTYTYNTTTTLDKHIKAIGAADPTPNNPHGLSPADIPGLTALLVTGEPQNVLYQKENTGAGVLSSTQLGFSIANAIATINVSLTPRSETGFDNTSPSAPQLFVAPLQAGEAFYLTGNRYDNTTPVANGIANSLLPAVSSQGSPSSVAPTALFNWTINFLGVSAGTYNVGIEVVSIGGTPNLQLVALTTTLPVGTFKIATVSFNGTNLSAVVDARTFGTISSASVQAADGTTGQNIYIGSGIKTNHIQDNAITTSKIAAGAAIDNTARLLAILF